ncbi:hypothetical protein [Streptomyces flavofungini]|uniref:hypothetical protein n=1 Tax=Streptomyces flavofungini TaxID=68200 RepID=UPI0025AF1446|nr:hypothetical protein [Streptomyces flavofungini]WJV48885.1 hypothetical protein QUY26_27260 [Streptomyces flavofungini]
MTFVPDFPLRAGTDFAGREIEPARPVPPDLAQRVRGALWASLLTDDVLDVLDRILDDAVPLSAVEAERYVRLLGECAWGLLGDELQRSHRCPDDYLVLQVRFAADLHLERTRAGAVPDAGIARRLALLVLNLLDRLDGSPPLAFTPHSPDGSKP